MHTGGWYDNAACSTTTAAAATTSPGPIFMTQVLLLHILVQCCMYLPHFSCWRHRPIMLHPHSRCLFLLSRTNVDVLACIILFSQPLPEAPATSASEPEAKARTWSFWVEQCPCSDMHCLGYLAADSLPFFLLDESRWISAEGCSSWHPIGTCTATTGTCLFWVWQCWFLPHPLIICFFIAAGWSCIKESPGADFW